MAYTLDGIRSLAIMGPPSPGFRRDYLIILSAPNGIPYYRGTINHTYRPKTLQTHLLGIIYTLLGSLITI